MVNDLHRLASPRPWLFKPAFAPAHPRDAESRPSFANLRAPLTARVAKFAP